MQELIEALMAIANPAQRERERRRCNREIAGSVTPVQVDTLDFFSSTGNALKLAAKGSIRGNTVPQSVLDALPADAPTSKKSKGTKRAAKAKASGVTASGKAVHGEKSQWNKAFEGAFNKAPEGWQRAAGKHAYGAVKFHGKSVRAAVSESVKMAEAAKAAGNKKGILATS